jgi:excisionase family DNA binding protein
MDKHPVDRLETPKQVAKRVGISEGKVRHLVQGGQLDCVMIGCRIHIPVDEWSRFIAAKRGKLCHDETKVQDCGISKSVAATTSPGQSEAAAASARPATADRNQAEIAFGEWMQHRGRRTGPSIPLRSS